MKLATIEPASGHSVFGQLNASSPELTYVLSADFSNMEGYVQVGGNGEQWLLTFTLDSPIRLIHRSYTSVPREVRLEARDRVEAALAEAIPDRIEEWRDASPRKARQLLGVAPRKPGPPTVSPVMWAHRAVIAGESASPAATLQDLFELDSKRTAEEWLARLTGAKRPIEDLDGRTVKFLEASGPQKRPSYTATPVALALAGGWLS